MKRSLTGEQLLEILKQSAYPQTPGQLADIAIRNGLLSEDYQAGQIKPQIAKTFPLSAAGEAHRFIQERRNTGKVLLIP